MDKRTTSIITTACLSLGILALLLFASFRSKPAVVPSNPVEGAKIASVAILKIFSSPVHVTLPNSEAAIDGYTGQEIPVGSTISTDANGRAELEYPRGTVTRIDHSSSITLTTFDDEPSQVEVSLQKGRIWSRVKKLLGKESYTTKTNTVVATVRGTSYGHEKFSNGSDKITTTKGEVHSDCVNDTQKADVPFDTKVLMDCQTKGDLHGTPLSNQDRDEWYSFNNAQDQELDNQYGLDNYQDEGGVLGLESQNDEVLTFTSPFSNLTPCIGPDGIHFNATSADCQKITDFWASHPPAGWGGSPDSGSSSDSGSSTSSSSSPTPTPTPLPDPTITDVTFQHCISTSCQNNTTVRVDGTNYSSHARVSITLPDSTVWSESTSNNQTPPDATVVGGDDSTYILTDFYGIPLWDFSCQSVDVTVYFTTAGDTRTATMSTTDPYYCN